ncbi:MAG: Lar family restriction alleviation protein [Synergistaceae bacterium]|nr:Lar family restriction alleviation protein [Synergistaceae bacterium]
MPELKPCPFCGHEVQMSYRDVQIYWAEPGQVARVWEIKCPECGAHMEDHYEHHLYDKWNGLTRLDRCPICGDYIRRIEPYEDYDEGTYYYVECRKCGLSTRKFSDSMEARVFWNARHGRG